MPALSVTNRVARSRSSSLSLHPARSIARCSASGRASRACVTQPSGSICPLWYASTIRLASSITARITSMVGRTKAIMMISRVAVAASFGRPGRRRRMRWNSGWNMIAASVAHSSAPAKGWTIHAMAMVISARITRNPPRSSASPSPSPFIRPP